MCSLRISINKYCKNAFLKSVFFVFVCFFFWSMSMGFLVEEGAPIVWRGLMVSWTFKWLCFLFCSWIKENLNLLLGIKTTLLWPYFDGFCFSFFFLTPSTGHVCCWKAFTTGGLGRTRCLGDWHAARHWRHAAVYLTTDSYFRSASWRNNLSGYENKAWKKLPVAFQ